MAYALSFIRDPFTGQFVLAPKKRKAKNSHPKQKNVCAGWLMHIYRTQQPPMELETVGVTFALTRVEWRGDLREWVAHYVGREYYSNGSFRRRLLFTCVWRGRQMVTIDRQRDWKEF